MIRRVLFSLAIFILPLSSKASLITSDDTLGNPLVTGAVQFFNQYIAPNTTFAYSLNFTTDSNAAKSSLAVIGLELSGVSGFTGPLTISLYRNKYYAGQSTDVLELVASTVGSTLSNISVLPSRAYAFVVEGRTGGTPNNVFSGSVSISGVPIPDAAWLFGAALVGAALVKRRRGQYGGELS